MITLKDNMIKLAVPNKGRLKEPTIELLQKAGYSFRMKDRLLYASCTNEPVQIIFLRTDDIPLLVDSGVIDMGITGSDLVLERNAKVVELLPLDYGRCRLCVAVKDEYQGKDLSELNGKRVATSFPRIAGDYFRSQNINVTLLEMSGSLEIMVGLKLADAIVDIVETGDTLRDNQLKVFSEIGSYQTKLLASKGAADKPEVQTIKRRIEGIMIARKYSLLEYNIPKARLKEAERVTPGFQSPTIAQLDDPDWLAVEVMVQKKEIPRVMDQLEALGAAAILETEIRNCRL
ncbi:MAG: ATP phosphoribosyltransferase [Spirochaetales bacterium]|nr:ATP phosphoribosyltransferase [Spirochaetales bacterium]